MKLYAYIDRVDFCMEKIEEHTHLSKDEISAISWNLMKYYRQSVITKKEFIEYFQIFGVNVDLDFFEYELEIHHIKELNDQINWDDNKFNIIRTSIPLGNFIDYRRNILFPKLFQYYAISFEQYSEKASAYFTVHRIDNFNVKGRITTLSGTSTEMSIPRVFFRSEIRKSQVFDMIFRRSRDAEEIQKTAIEKLTRNSESSGNE